MKKLFVITSLVVVVQSFSYQQNPEFSEKEEKLFRKNGCRLCHRVDKNKIGPSYITVAEKYKNDAKAVEKIKASIKNGGTGKWGKKEMPPNPEIADSTLTRLANAILKLNSF